MSIESKVFLDLARIWNLGPGEVETIVRDYIGAVTCDFKPLQPYPKPHIHIIPVKVKTLKERLEETKMKATSTEEFKDIIAIDFELQTFPNPDVQDKFIVSATNRDDIFAFVFEGPNIVDACRQTGLFTGWEKDQKIKYLEKENKIFLDVNRKLQEKIFHLEELKTPTIENFEKPSDNVNHPSHYTGRYECIDVMQDVFGDEATDNFCLCNAFKYIWRARKKNGLEDVKKAVWYLNKYIEEAEKDGVSKGE